MMTNEESATLSEADEIAALLPWYVTGKISAADKARIEAYVRAHPEVEHQIALAREEADAVFAANQEIALPRQTLDTFKARLAKSSGSRFERAGPSLLDRIGGLLGELSPRQLAYVGIAAVLAIAVQTASIGALLKHWPSATYQTASGPKEQLATGTFAFVAFQPAAPASGLSAFLADNGWTVVEGPKPGGLYRVRVSDKVLAKADADVVLAKLKARSDLIAFASAAPSSPLGDPCCARLPLQF